MFERCNALYTFAFSDRFTNVASQYYRYRLHIYTADKFFAGTYARVYVRLYGERGNLPETHINPPGNAFQRNQ